MTRPTSPEKMAVIHELFRDGLPHREIAERVGMTTQGISVLLGRRPAAPRTEWTPACMDPDEVADWRAGRTPACTECPIVHYERMLALGRCNGFPAELMRGAVDPTENADVTEPRRRRRRLPA